MQAKAERRAFVTLQAVAGAFTVREAGAVLGPRCRQVFPLKNRHGEKRSCAGLPSGWILSNHPDQVTGKFISTIPCKTTASAPIFRRLNVGTLLGYQEGILFLPTIQHKEIAT